MQNKITATVEDALGTERSDVESIVDVELLPNS